jgi:crotonobetainyl-CoA:carnitine CoA-transferase CaiB-like acyl-CoA transferase
MARLPLEGLRVADFSQGVAGPLASLLLGDLGAAVFKVEPPRGDWIRSVGRRTEHRMSPTYVGMNRNKKGLCVEMKDPRGLALVAALARSCDVVVESFRPGVMERFGLDYGTLRAGRPGLVYASVTGYGPEGPYAELPGSDSILQAMGGIMSMNGADGGEPLRFGMFMVDMITGMTAYQGLLGALLARSAGGEGQHVQVSLLDAILAFQAAPLTEYLMYGLEPERNGNVNSFVAPSGVFQTRDSFVMFTVLDQHWAACCRVLGLEALEHDPRFATNAARMTHRGPLLEQVRARLRERNTAEWLAVFREADILCAPINDYKTLVSDPQVAVNDAIRFVPHDLFGRLPWVRHPVRYGSFEPPYAPPPRLGEHSREVLQEELGFDPAEVEALLAAGVIHVAPAGGDGGAEVA